MKMCTKLHPHDMPHRYKDMHVFETLAGLLIIMFVTFLIASGLASL
jgi:hypothetical protein